MMAQVILDLQGLTLTNLAVLLTNLADLTNLAVWKDLAIRFKNKEGFKGYKKEDF